MDQIGEIILKLKITELEAQLALREIERVRLNWQIDKPEIDEDETIPRDHPSGASAHRMGRGYDRAPGIARPARPRTRTHAARRTELDRVKNGINMKVMDLGDWPPKPRDTFGKDDVLPQSTDEVTVESYLIYNKGNVVFSCRFNHRVLIYRMFIANQATAERVIKLVQKSRGKRLTDIGLTEIPTA